MKKVHHLKSWPIFFEQIIANKKRHDLRKDDRDFEVGDVLALHEYDPFRKSYTDRVREVEVTYITRPNGDEACAFSPEAIARGFCILSIKA